MSDDSAELENDFPEPDPENYVGRGHPPKATQWKKGFCPNRSGRPRKQRTRRYFLVQVAYRKIAARDGSRKRKMTILEAIVSIVKLKAIGTGNAVASRMLEKLSGYDISQDAVPAVRGVLISYAKMKIEDWLAETQAYRDKQRETDRPRALKSQAGTSD